MELPPEMLGSHIAAGASHTTGRNHDIAYRAATAVFGHLGVEWDLAKATEDELGQLTAWIACYREHREVLNARRLVRVDLLATVGLRAPQVLPERTRVLGLHRL